MNQNVTGVPIEPESCNVDLALLNQPQQNMLRSRAMSKSSALADCTSEQIARAKKWAETWRLAGEDLERIRRKKIRELDIYQAIARLCRLADFTQPPYAPKPWSGLIEQQEWYKKAAGRE